MVAVVWSGGLWGDAGPACCAPTMRDILLRPCDRAGAIRLEDVVGRAWSKDWGFTRRVKSLREVVGKEEAREFAVWGRAQSGGPQAILREAQRIAERHGVIAEYGGDAGVAELVTDGILRLRHDEWLPQQVSVDAEWFPAEVRRTRVASFDPDLNSLLINPEQEYWRLSSVERVEWVANLHRAGYFATDDVRHPVLHELGHAALWRGSRVAYERLPADFTAFELEIAGQVGERAMYKPAEFMAEVFVSLLQRNLLPDSVRELYNRWGGVKP